MASLLTLKCRGAVARPYTLEPEASLDLMAPKLNLIECESADAKAKLFVDSVIAEVMVPKVLQGDASIPFLQGFCASLGHCLSKDLEEVDIAEHYARSILVVQDSSQALLTLLSDDVLGQMQHQEVVNHLKSLQRTRSSSAQVKLANAIASSTYWGERMKSFMANVTALVMHKEKLESWKEWLLTSVERTEAYCMQLRDQRFQSKLFKICWPN